MSCREDFSSHRVASVSTLPLMLNVRRRCGQSGCRRTAVLSPRSGWRRSRRVASRVFDDAALRRSFLTSMTVHPTSMSMRRRPGNSVSRLPSRSWSSRPSPPVRSSRRYCNGRSPRCEPGRSSGGGPGHPAVDLTLVDQSARLSAYHGRTVCRNSGASGHRSRRHRGIGVVRSWISWKALLSITMARFALAAVYGGEHLAITGPGGLGKGMRSTGGARERRDERVRVSGQDERDLLPGAREYHVQEPAGSGERLAFPAVVVARCGTR